MESCKIIFFDIDGTLIDMETKKISEKTVETLQRLRANGIKLCIATGRSPVSLPDFHGVEFDAFLTFNGSFCYASNRTIFSNPICHTDVQRLIRNANSLGRPVCVATKNRLVANGSDTDLADYFYIAHQTVPVSPDFDAVCNEEIYQLMLGCRKNEYTTLLDGITGAKIAGWWDRAVDVIPASGGKGIGIQKVLDYYNLDKSEAIAFGDGNNDIEMLTAVGTGVAMKNASTELKAVSSEICGAVSQDGIYHYCVRNRLI